MRHGIKPSKSMSKASFFIMIPFMFLGLGMIFMGLTSPVGPVIAVFGIFWTAMAGFNMYRAYKNGFTDEGMPYYDIVTEEDESDFENRLRKLQRLKEDGLISQEEFDLKRREIMADKW